MSATINFGIDLGTTNSLIARGGGTEPEVFKNPIGLKETLPSAVAYRKGRILIGDKAKEYVERDPANVFTGFKRKMGTAERFFVPEIMDFRSPVELSALILQELRNFVYTGETVDAAVITIPASFDTIQSNATKEAGYEAGFKEVILLQEPVAASLAFANKRESAGQPLEGQWLVYDLGGGTFDVALVRFEGDEMRVTDHEGDNFLGGLDFDSALIEKVVVPYLAQHGGFPDIATELRNPSGPYGRLYYTLLHKAEEAKIMLSSQPQTEIEFEIEDVDGGMQDIAVPLSREQLEDCIRPQVEHSLRLVEKLLAKHPGLEPREVILIGGSTYIPLVRSLLGERLGIRVNAGVDPTTAVAVGAAYFAATRKRQQAATATEPGTAASSLQIRTAYAKTSREPEEYFTAQVQGDLPSGLQYRIQRTDGGFDSGLKPLGTRISEMLPLLPQSANSFRFSVVDAKGLPVPAQVPAIEIVQGHFSIEGQPLPADICLEVDDPVNKTTRLEVVFEKNNVLPLKKTLVREVTRMLRRGTEDTLVINVLEGNRYALPASNLCIGAIEIKACALDTDIVKGSDVEIVMEINESRDLRIEATLLMNEQRFGNVFTPSLRQISVDRLRGELKDLLWDCGKSLEKAGREEHFELAAQLQEIQERLQQLQVRAARLGREDAGDEKYALDERKRVAARELDTLTREAGLAAAVDEYLNERDYCFEIISADGDPARLERFRRIIAGEQEYLAGQSVYTLKSKVREFRRLSWELRRRDPVALISSFMYYNGLQESAYRDPGKAQQLLEQGEHAIERQNYDELTAVLQQVAALEIDNEQRESFNGTGLG